MNAVDMTLELREYRLWQPLPVSNCRPGGGPTSLAWRETGP
jgi:hypothetical protein